MKQHVTIVGILHIASGALSALAGIIVAVVLSLVAIVPEEAEGQLVLLTVGLGVGLFLFVLALPRIIGGIWLLRYSCWARYLIMFYSALALVNIPIGTAIGVYSLWALTQRETAELFASGSR